MSHFGRSGTSADDLFPLFDKYGKVVDVFIPRDRRTGESRGFAFVRYKYADEAQKAVDRPDGRVVDGREITVQFAKYGPNAERINRGRIIEKIPSGRSRSRSPRRSSRYHDDYPWDRDYRRSHSRSWDGYRGRERHSRYRSRSRSYSPDYGRGGRRGRYSDKRLSRSLSIDRSLSPRRTPTRDVSSDSRSVSLSRSVSPYNRHPESRSPSPYSPVEE